MVEEINRPIKDVKRPVIGSKPIDGGYYIFTEQERKEFLDAEPGAKDYLHPYIGAEEFIYGEVRYILALQSASPAALRKLPKVVERMNEVSRFRQGGQPSKKDVARGKTEIKKRGAGTIAMAATPTAYHVTVIPKAPFLVIPEASLERRDYVPIAWLEPPVIPSNLVRVILDADLWDFGLITSRMHMAWLRNIGGRLKSDYRYSIGIVYNPFPWPEKPDKKTHDNICALAQGVLDARKRHPESTLADLYDPDVMPLELRKAHHALDAAIDKLYRSAAFSGDRERVEHLFSLYEQLVSPLIATTKQKRGKRRTGR